MPLIELKDYTLAPEGAGYGLSDLNFSLSEGDVYSIHADSADDATLLLKALATLVCPVRGVYCFKGEKINLDDYRNSLPCKKRIGYIAPDSAMISNRTLRENLLFMRYFYEDSLLISLDEQAAGLCRKFDILEKLDMKPGELTLQDIHNAITVREICKDPDVLLLERPEDFIDHTKFDFFKEILSDLSLSKLPVVFFSFDTGFMPVFSNKKVRLSKGRLTTVMDERK